MKIIIRVVILIIIVVIGFWYLLFSQSKQTTNTQNSVQEQQSLTSYLDTVNAIQSLLAQKYNKPVAEVKVTVSKEVPGFATGSVLFGKGGPGEGGMWLAVSGNGWNIVWDGNGSVDCNTLRQEYGFPDSILKPNFCD